MIATQPGFDLGIELTDVFERPIHLQFMVERFSHGG
jgi:hypothetical protein